MNKIVLVMFFAGIAFGVTASILCAQPTTTQRRNVAFLVWDSVEMIELMGPAQIFASSPGFDEYTVSSTRKPISSSFFKLVPEYTFKNCPTPDIIVVPGGIQGLADAEMRDWLARMAPKVEAVMSVCNGALILANAGVLNHRTATTASGHLDELVILGSDIRAYKNRRYEKDSQMITSQSYFAGVDTALFLVSQLHDRETAQRVADWNNYEWRLDEFERLHKQDGELAGTPRLEIFETIRRDGVDEAVALYRRMKEKSVAKNGETDPDLPQERHFQFLAWTLESAGHGKDAVDLCRFVVKAFPDSGKAIAGLGEALIASGDVMQAVALLADLLKSDPDNRRVWILLHRSLMDKSCTTNDVSQNARELLRNTAVSETVRANPLDEPGIPMHVSGVVQSASGEPIAGALIHIFLADQRGFYTTNKAMDEPNSRLFAYMRTDKDGRYVFDTIRPGGYPDPHPNLPEGRNMIPEHIHFEITADGYEDRAFQLVFEDDPRMIPSWREWATRGHHPLVPVSTDPWGSQSCMLNITLEAKG